MGSFPHLLKADEIPLPLGLKVNDAAPRLLLLVESLELLLLAQAFCTGLIQLLERRKQNGREGEKKNQKVADSNPYASRSAYGEQPKVLGFLPQSQGLSGAVAWWTGLGMSSPILEIPLSGTRCHSSHLREHH